MRCGPTSPTRTTWCAVRGRRPTGSGQRRRSPAPASSTRRCRVRDMTAARMRRMLEVNTLGTMLTAREAVRRMVPAALGLDRPRRLGGEPGRLAGPVRRLRRVEGRRRLVHARSVQGGGRRRRAGLLRPTRDHRHGDPRRQRPAEPGRRDRRSSLPMGRAGTPTRWRRRSSGCSATTRATSAARSSTSAAPAERPLPVRASADHGQPDLDPDLDVAETAGRRRRAGSGRPGSASRSGACPTGSRGRGSPARSRASAVGRGGGSRSGRRCTRRPAELVPMNRSRPSSCSTKRPAVRRARSGHDHPDGRCDGWWMRWIARPSRASRFERMRAAPSPGSCMSGRPGCDRLHHHRARRDRLDR